MMEIVRTVDGEISAHFEAVELDLLRLATTQLIELLTDASDDPDVAGSDPAIQRMLPDAYLTDPEAAAEFRRFTADDLMAGKIHNATTVFDSLTTAQDSADAAEFAVIVLTPDQVQSWLRTLTDLRLTLAARLKITPDGRFGLQGSDAAFLGELYEWLGMVQESVVYAIDR
ncbi:DUF2017 family protein [Glaciibacter psychrotolerans]|uniref:DUF2017 family protein n=1 Tax=Glaciibacter psychrotolerans TaxID=670054 RepID=A0A7Z0J569_9MICO|nr:DUF2017 family protein [Leifsonia psychrotolerans]NYJ18786.1 hypothetical protein [Leifsonia psychrotolerans]